MASKYCCILHAIYLPAVAMSWLPLQHIPRPQLCAAHYLGVHSATQPSPIATNTMQLSLPSPIAMPLSTLSLQSPFVLRCIAMQPGSLSLQGLSPSILPLQCNSVLSSLSLFSTALQCNTALSTLSCCNASRFSFIARPSRPPSSLLLLQPLCNANQLSPVASLSSSIQCHSVLFHCNAPSPSMAMQPSFLRLLQSHPHCNTAQFSLALHPAFPHLAAQCNATWLSISHWIASPCLPVSCVQHV